jgi:hypothetical protein
MSASPQIRLHVDGDGLFRFARGSQAVYSTDALLSAGSGVLASPEGYPLLPPIHVPTSGVGIRVSIDGTVSVNGSSVGRIVLASFGNAQLQRAGPYLTSYSRSSIGYPGEGVFGIIRVVSGSAPPPAKTATHPLADDTATVEVALKSEIEKPQILLSDIAKITAPDDLREAIGAVDLGAAPLFGSYRGVLRSQLVAKMRSRGLDPDKMQVICPDGAIVVRKGQKVAESAMIAAAIEGAKNRLGIDMPMRTDRPIGDAWVPDGNTQIVVADAVQNGDNVAVSLEIQVAGKTEARRTVGLLPSVATPKVNVGDPVKVKLSRNGASVEVSGKLRSAGRVGSTVTVETEEGAVLTGVLRSTSLVEVKL